MGIFRATPCTARRLRCPSARLRATRRTQMLLVGRSRQGSRLGIMRN